MEIKLFIGIDVSKENLDFSVIKNNQELFHYKTENAKPGIQAFVKELKKLQEFTWTGAVFCMEHTGIYNYHLLEFFHKKKANIWLESAIHIKQSSGLQRGKNDKVDAYRIAMFAYKNREEMKLWAPKREVLQRLNNFTTVRLRLINAIKQLSTPIKELGGMAKNKIKKEAQSHCANAIKGLKKDLEKVNKSILGIIDQDPEIKKLYTIITSIPGVGTVTATGIILTTNEFKDIKEAKKYSCYSGIAPFEHSSGSSIRGRTRVSKMANKSIKTLLHMSALSAIVYNPEIKLFYERKVAEGKNKMSVINAVRNKLIHRIFACVNQNRKYENIYTNSLA